MIFSDTKSFVAGDRVETAARRDPDGRCRQLFAAHACERGGDPCARDGAVDTHRAAGDRRAWRPRHQEYRGWLPRRVRQRGRCGAGGHAVPGRRLPARGRRCGRPADSVSRRHQCRRRHRRRGRHLRRRRQYRGAARGRRRTRRHLSVGLGLRSGIWQDRDGIRRPGRATPEEYRPPDPRLCDRPGRIEHGEAGRRQRCRCRSSAPGSRSWCCRSSISAAIRSRNISSTA